jgi:toxin YoeB
VRLVFDEEAWAQYLSWQRSDPKILQRLNSLIEESTRHPFTGTGKPEPLRQELRGWWSRRINREHRLVYRVSGSGKEQSLEILSCRYHY